MVTQEQACADVATTTCAKALSCLGSFVLDTLFGGMTSCVASQKQGCLTGQGLKGTALTPQAVEACATTLGTATCDALLATHNPTEICALPAGTLVMGSACAESTQCASLFCPIKEGYCGTCQPPSTVGSACPCSPGFQCDYMTMKCQARPTSLGASGAPCEENTKPCSYSLRCFNGVCTAPLAENVACDPEHKTTTHCNTWVGLRCDSGTMKCQKIPIAQLGDNCGEVGAQTIAFCANGSYCKQESFGSAGKCTTRAKVGEACNSGNACELALMCRQNKCQVVDASMCM